MSELEVVARAEHRRERRRRRTELLAAGLVVLLAVTASGQTYLTSRAVDRTVRCQVDLNERVIAALAARDEAAAAEHDAQRRLLTLPRPVDPVTAETERRRYLSVLEQLNRAETANPLPTDLACR